jgi:hypothetical protein
VALALVPAVREQRHTDPVKRVADFPQCVQLVACQNLRDGSELVFCVPVRCSPILADQAVDDLFVLDPGGESTA